MATKRELIVQDIVAALKTISVANGYATELGANVQRYQHDVQDFGNPPLAVVSNAGGQYDNAEIQVETKETLALAIAIGCDNPADDWTQGAEAWADVYLRDVQRAVMVDPTRGGRAIDTQFDSWEFVDSDAREFGVALFLAISYYHSHEDPAS